MIKPYTNMLFMRDSSPLKQTKTNKSKRKQNKKRQQQQQQQYKTKQIQKRKPKLDRCHELLSYFAFTDCLESGFVYRDDYDIFPTVN